MGVCVCGGGEQGGYMCVHVNGGQRSTSNVNPWALSTMISEKGSLISPELTSLSSLTSQQTPESSNLLLRDEIVSVPSHVALFMGAEDPTHALGLVLQAFDQLSP